MKKTILLVILLAVMALSACEKREEEQVYLTERQMQWIGEKIFNNECGGKIECLVSWNEREEFMSLGIGHFIWYPPNTKVVFQGSFVDLLNFMKERGAVLPYWLEGNEKFCPWKTRDEFLKDAQNPKIADLRKFLWETKSLQVEFIVERQKRTLPRMLEVAPPELRPHIEEQFYRVASTAGGIYVLIDYVNFKGGGTLTSESYKGQNWGLLQVCRERRQAGLRWKNLLALQISC